MDSYKCVIVANGEFPTRKATISVIEQAKYVIACDGAVEHLDTHNLPVSVVIGDLDSLPNELVHKYGHITIQISDQDTNDVTKAVLFAKQQGFREIVILGATGLREDHTLGNISLLGQFIEWFDSVEMISDYGVFIPITATSIFNTYPGQQISIFSLYPNVPMSVIGLKFPIEKRQLLQWWEGTLNEALSYSFTVILHGTEGKAIIYKLHA
ncbi:MAG: thiamine diphosphokinase [Marinifilaceae bacterium]